MSAAITYTLRDKRGETHTTESWGAAESLVTLFPEREMVLVGVSAKHDPCAPEVVAAERPCHELGYCAKVFVPKRKQPATAQS